jgi:hypothetical protein
LTSWVTVSLSRRTPLHVVMFFLKPVYVSDRFYCTPQNAVPTWLWLRGLFYPIGLECRLWGWILIREIISRWPPTEVCCLNVTASVGLKTALTYLLYKLTINFAVHVLERLSEGHQVFISHSHTHTHTHTHTLSAPCELVLAQRIAVTVSHSGWTLGYRCYREATRNKADNVFRVRTVIAQTRWIFSHMRGMW